MKRLISLLCSYALLFAPTHSYATESTGTPVTANFTVEADSATPIPNPDRYEAAWAGADLLTDYDSAGISSAYSSGYRLLKCQVSLQSFTTTSISGAFLTNLQARFDSIRSAGMKCSLKFQYDSNSGSGIDATAAQIAAHLAQLKPYLYANADIIPFMNAGFIGAWGEWHSSTNCNAYSGWTSQFPVAGCTIPIAVANRLTIKNAIVGAVHPSTFVQFRYPSDMMTWYPTPISSSSAYSGTLQSRIGMHNDCMLSSADLTDSGTWTTGGNGTSFTTAQKKTYVDTSSNYTPYGGEIIDTGGCGTALRTSCAEAIADFSRWHLSWLMVSAGSMASYRSAWSSGGCTNQIANLMGYRIQYNSVTHQGTASAGQTITATVSVRNAGWSRVHRPRKIQLVMVRSGGGASDIICNSRVDLRNLPPQSSTYSIVSIGCTTGIAGTWNVHLRIPDIYTTTQTKDFAIRPANTNSGGQTWDSTNYRWTTGTTVVVS